MIIDQRTEFCDATALNTGAPNTFVIGNRHDLQNARDLGNGSTLFLVISVATGINAAGAGTVQFQFVSADNSDLTSNPVVHAMSAAFVTSTTSGNAGGALAAGRRLLIIALPQEGVEYKRFIGIRQVTGAQAITAGAVDAFLTHDVANWKSYDAPFQL